MSAFASLHRPGDPFVLPNAWDLGSARALVDAGFPALGTTSLGIASALGVVDGAREARAGIVDLAIALQGAELGVPVTVDLEDGLADEPEEVAEIVARLGVAGVNVEDSSAGRVTDPARHAAKVAAITSRCPEVFVNARTDVFWCGDHDLDDAVDRLTRYVDAGAQGVFLPGALEPEVVAEVVRRVPAPLNVLASATLTRDELAGLGVARISTGSLLYRVALRQAVDAAHAVGAGTAVPAATPYDEVQKLHGG